jgi:cholesterol transport system auxiliary component
VALLIFFSLSLILMSACSSSRKFENYDLQAGIPARPVAWSSGKVLRVSEPRAQPGFEGRGMVYARSAQELGYYPDSQWADALPRMLALAVVRMLQDTAAFGAVLTSMDSAAADLRLELDVIRLQNELWEKPGRVRLTLRAKLFDEATGHVLGTQLFEMAPVAFGEDASELAKGAEAAVRQLLPELRDFVLLYAPGVARS